MSTTIERALRTALFLRAATLVLTGWFSILAVVTLVAEPSRSVAVFAPTDRAFRALAHSDALMLAGGAGFVIARGQHAGFVRELYAGGAWLVLPVWVGGCRLPSSSPVRGS